MAEVSPARVKRAYKELWQQYEEMEERFDGLLRKLAELRKEVTRREEMTSNLKAVLDQRDRKLEGYKGRIFENERRIESRRTEMELLETYLAEDRSAYEAALDTISMLKKDLAVANEEVRLRDYWFSANRQLLEHLVDIQRDRETAIQRARLRGVREFRVEDAGPTLEEALEGMGLEAEAVRRITDRASERPVSELLPLSDRALEDELGLEPDDALLARRALDRIAFGQLPGLSMAGASPEDGVLTIAVNPPPGTVEAGNGVAVVEIAEPQEYAEGLDMGLLELARAFHGGVSQVLDHAGGASEVRMVLAREGDEAVVMDDRMMLRDNNFLVGLHRVQSRGISLAPGAVPPMAEDEPARDLTQGELYKDITSRLDLEPGAAKKALGPGEDAAVATPSDRPPHPYTALALQAAASYLKQYPKMRFRLMDVVVPAGRRLDLA